MQAVQDGVNFTQVLDAVASLTPPACALNATFHLTFPPSSTRDIYLSSLNISSCMLDCVTERHG